MVYENQCNFYNGEMGVVLKLQDLGLMLDIADRVRAYE